jgi:ribosomal protein S18 acetylase RimI-like enzyme
VGVVGLEHGDEEMVIARLFVAPSSFRRGVGSALVAHALAQAAGRRVRVGTGGRNAPALALYERFGFHRLDDGSPTPTRGYVELVREP